MSQKPLFLLSNDDGIHAPGIRILAEAMRAYADVMVVAPHVEKSACSHAITISMPLRVEQFSDWEFAVEGTPADCVMFALQSLLKDRKPDWVISGINRGSNLGNDTLYSGTVGAAMEGALHGIPAMAVSAHGTDRSKLNYKTAAKVASKLIENSDVLKFDSDGVINLNVPDVEYDQLAGVKVATMGRRIYEEHFTVGTDPRGREYYWVGGGGHLFADIPGSDCDLIDKNFATVSFLRPSLYHEQANEILKKQLDSIAF